MADHHTQNEDNIEELGDKEYLENSTHVDWRSTPICYKHRRGGRSGVHSGEPPSPFHANVPVQYRHTVSNRQNAVRYPNVAIIPEMLSLNGVAMTTTHVCQKVPCSKTSPVI